MPTTLAPRGRLLTDGTTTGARPRITLLGTGHVFDLRMRVTEEIFRRAPSVVALELDAGRYRALLAPPDAKRDAPLVYRAVADFQERLASAYGVRAGDEMRAASDAARDLRVPVALIDVDARATFHRLKKEMPFGEKTRLALATVGSLFTPSKGIEEQVEALAADYAFAFDEMARKFPTLKRILLDERNAHMTRALVDLSRAHERVVAVVGDGHVDGMRTLLDAASVPVETVRLKELRQRPTPAGTASATFTVDWKD